LQRFATAAQHKPKRRGRGTRSLATQGITRLELNDKITVCGAVGQLSFFSYSSCCRPSLFSSLGGRKSMQVKKKTDGQKARKKTTRRVRRKGDGEVIVMSMQSVASVWLLDLYQRISLSDYQRV
jgi:hypothetical protein